MLNSATGILLLHHHEFILQINQICLVHDKNYNNQTINAIC